MSEDTFRSEITSSSELRSLMCRGKEGKRENVYAQHKEEPEAEGWLICTHFLANTSHLPPYPSYLVLFLAWSSRELLLLSIAEMSSRMWRSLASSTTRLASRSSVGECEIYEREGERVREGMCATPPPSPLT